MIECDPENADGPLRLVGGKWYWLSSSVPEIVVVDDIPVVSLTRLAFEKHREIYCHLDRGGSCREKGHSGSLDADVSFVAHLLGSGAMGMDDLMVRDGGFGFGVEGGFTSLWVRLFRGHEWGGPLADDVTAVDAITSACRAYCAGDRDKAKRLMALIDTEERAERLFLDLIRTRFDIPGYTWRD